MNATKRILLQEEKNDVCVELSHWSTEERALDTQADDFYIFLHTSDSVPYVSYDVLEARDDADAIRKVINWLDVNS